MELSFKAHLCGGGMVEVPCSRIGHTYRYKNYYKRFGDDGQDYVIKNHKRIAEVWLDEYKELVYAGNKAIFAAADAGNMIRAKGMRRGLHCKPFRYFLEFVAPEMLERYPLEDPGFFAQGAIQSKANAKLCLEVPRGGNRKQIILADCEKNLVNPHTKQFFKLAWHRNIQHASFDFCLQDSMTMSECHFQGGNQLWKFDMETSQIIYLYQDGMRCLTVDSTSLSVTLQECYDDTLNQKWNWGEKNITALGQWDSFGVHMSKLKLSLEP